MAEKGDSYNDFSWLVMPPSKGLVNYNQIFVHNTFINEIDYDEPFADWYERIEIASSGKTNLSTWKVVFYNASGAVYLSLNVSSFTNGGVVSNFSGGVGFTYYDWPAGVDDNLLNTTGGIALVDENNYVWQFLSYGGTITATSGPASGLVSQDIGIVDNAGADYRSLQLQGRGLGYEDFVWAGPIRDTFGSVNTSQTMAEVLNLAPYVVSTDPYYGEKEVSLSKTIRVDYSEDMWLYAGTDPALLVCARSGSVVTTQSLDTADRSVLVIDPDTNLLPADTCTLTVYKANIEEYTNSTNSNYLHPVTDYVLTFTTYNQAPTANPQTVAATEDIPQNFTLTASDPEGLAISAWTIKTPPTYGTISGTGPTFTYTPYANFNGTDSFTYTVKDNLGKESTPATVTLNVSPVNDAPSFVKGNNLTVNEDSGPSSTSGWATSISPGPSDEVGQTVSFTVSNNNNTLFSAQPSIDANGTLTFTPAANQFGTATVTVYLSDNGGTANGGVDTSASQTFTITVNAVNDAPSFTKGANHTSNEDAGAQTTTGWATNISAGPANEAGQTLIFTVTTDNPTLFSAGPAISSTGTLTYTAAPDARGTATVTVTLKDNGGTTNGGVDTSASQTFTITVLSVNDAPYFTKGADQTILEDAAPQTVTGWATGISTGAANEINQTVSFTVTNDNAALFATAPAIAPDGTLTYAIKPNVSGTAVVTVVIKDSGGTANGGIDTGTTATFNINVTSVNDVPSFTGGPDQTANEDDPAITIANWATNISAGPADESTQTLTFQVTNDNNALFSVQPAISSDGTLTYTLAADMRGTAHVTVRLKDDGGTANGGVDTTAEYVFDIVVNPVNDQPYFTVGTDQTVLEDSGAQSIAAWATGIAAGPSNEAYQTYTFTAVAADTTLFSAQPTVSPAGVLSFTPALNAYGSTTVSVTLKDNGGTANGGIDTSITQTFTITITAVNDEPYFTLAGDKTVLEDSGLNTFANFASGISAGAANESSQVLTWHVSNSNNALFSVQPSLAADGTLILLPQRTRSVRLRCRYTLLMMAALSMAAMTPVKP